MSSLGVHAILLVLSCGGSNDFIKSKSAAHMLGDNKPESSNLIFGPITFEPAKANSAKEEDDCADQHYGREDRDSLNGS